MNSKILLFIFALFLCMPAVLSIGLTSPFFGDSIAMYPGETRIVTFVLQNMVGEKDIDVVVELAPNQNIAQLITPTNFVLPYGSNNIPVSIQITLPQNAQESYPIAFSVKTVNPKSLKTLQLAVGLEKRFTVVLTEKPAVVEEQPQPVPPAMQEQPPTLPPDTNVVLLAIIVVIIAVILYRVVRKHKEKYGLKRVKDAFK